jgi:hypothetical protein
MAKAIRAICLVFGVSIVISGCAVSELPRYSVQLGVFSKEGWATDRVNNEPVEGAGLFRQVAHYTNAGGKNLWRALIDGFETEDGAKAYCLELRSRNVECLWRKSTSSEPISSTVGPVSNNVPEKSEPQSAATQENVDNKDFQAARQMPPLKKGSEFKECQGKDLCFLNYRSVRLTGDGEKTSVPGIVVYQDYNSTLMTVVMPQTYSMPCNTCDIAHGCFQRVPGDDTPYVSTCAFGQPGMASEDVKYKGIPIVVYRELPSATEFDVKNVKTGKIVTVRRRH